MRVEQDADREILLVTAAVLWPVSELQAHPVYTELRFSVSPSQLAGIKRWAAYALRDPLLITRDGVIIDGYARKAYADCAGIASLICIELDLGEEEALRMILSKHTRTASWNDYNRIRMASHFRSALQIRAQANQKAGGQLKGLSKLTEANVRKEIAEAACVSEGNVAKFDQLHTCNLQVLNALAAGEIRIHRAWLWRKLSPREQCDNLRQFRLTKDLKLRVKTQALRGHSRSSRIVLTVATLEDLLRRALSTPASDREKSDLIEIEIVNAPGKRIALTTELYETFLAEGSVD